MGMSKLHSKKHLRGRYEYQILDFGVNGNMKRGYVKLFYQGDVIDRALTVTRARQLAKQHEANRNELSKRI